MSIRGAWRRIHVDLMCLEGYRPALLSLGVAAGLHLGTLPLFHGRFAWTIYGYLVAMVVSAWCGFGPGILGITLAAGVLPYFYRENFSVSQLNPVSMAGYLSICFTVSAIATHWRRNERAMRRMKEEVDERVQEALDRLLSERDQAMKALERSEEQLRSFVSHIPGEAFLVDAGGNYLLGKPGWTGVDDAAARAEVLAAGKPVQTVEEDRRDGTPRYWLVTRFPMTGREGETLIGGTAFDISETRRLEAELEQARKMEAIGQLAGGVAHDFNNLLTVINGYAALLLSQTPDEASRRQLRNIAEAGDRAAALTRQLLAFGRKQMLQPTAVDVNGAVAGMAAMLERVIPESIRVSLRLDPRARRIFVDPTQFEQVLLNLVVNARDAMPKGGELVIETANAADGGGVLVSVSDTGVGIAPELQGLVFEPFYTTKKEGTGLGLATVYGIVKQSRGHIDLESEAGRGTTFRLYFPAAAGAADEEEREEAAGAGGGAERVLVVEDDEGVREFSATILREAGYEVLTAANGEEAVNIASNEPGIDILITDIVLPRMAGPEIAERIRGRHPALRVLYSSGYSEDAAVRGGLQAGTEEFLAKPYSRDQLLGALRRVLSTR